MEKKKGFTLIELLAVIVILAVIALIAVPVIMNIINSAKRSAFKDTAYGIVKSGELYYANKLLDISGMTEEMIFTFPDETGDLEINGSLPASGNMKVTKDGKIALAISDGKYCVTKGLNDADVKVTEDVENCVIPVPITNLSFTETDVVVYVGEQTTLTPTIEPSGATNTKLNWVSDNTSVVTVENGVLTGVANGTATVIVSTTDGSNITKTINVTVKTIYTNGILRSEDACIQNGNKCSDTAILSDEGIKVTVQVSPSESHNFYVIADTGNELTLLMESNIVEISAWNEADNVAQGPITALNILKSSTDGWDNIDTREYTYNDDGGGNLYSDVKMSMKARMLTYNEATSSALGCKAENKSCKEWVYGKLDGDSSTEMSHAYWTSAAFASGGNSWVIMSTGALFINSLSVAKPGIRPVITVTK